VGTGLYKNSLPDSMDQWQRVRQPAPLGSYALGMSGYSYATPSSEGDTGRALANATITYLFDRSAGVPVLPWKDMPSLGHLAGRLVQHTPCHELDGMPVQLSGPQARDLLADGSGWFGAIDLPPGEYLLSVDAGGPEAVTVPVTIAAGLVTEVQVQLPFCAAYPLYLPLLLRP
jgi:hypothetical protein